MFDELYNNLCKDFNNIINNGIPALIFFIINIVFALLIFFIGIKIIKKIHPLINKSLQKLKLDQSFVSFCSSLLTMLLYCVLFSIIALQFGVTATTIAALVGSIAVTIGLALQGSLSNFAGGLIIILVKPFKIGDYIKVSDDKYEGYVEDIQIFYTRVRTRDNKIVIVPNSKLTDTVVVNNTSFEERRMSFIIPIEYSQDYNIASKVIIDAINNSENIANTREPMTFIKEFGESSINIEVRFYVKSKDYYDIEILVLNEIYKAFEENKITIPYNKLDVNIISK